MDGDNATRFVASLVKSIQALCNGYIDFSTSIEVIGHIHLNIDRSVKLDYVLTEEVSKSVSEGATVFASHSYHSHPPSSVSSKNSNDSSKSSRQKQSVCVTQGSEADPLGFSSSVPLASSKSDSHSHARSSSHFVESSDSSHADNFVDSHDTESVKQEKSRTSFQVQESQERRRRSAPSHSQSQSHRTTSPAAKRIRHTDSNPEDFEVVEIKEEPDDEPAVFFGDSSSHMAAGQDLQTPDFSSVVMESLDRVGQVEGTKLVASGDGAQMQQPPFPVMMHSNTGMPSSSVSSAMPGPSLSDPQAQSLASTSGGGETSAIPVVKSEVVDSDDHFAPEWSRSSSLPVRLQTVHYMERIPPKGTKTNTQKRCFVCKKMGIRRDSRLHCIVCPEKPGLCRGTECFRIYHQWKGIPVGSDQRSWVSNS